MTISVLSAVGKMLSHVSVDLSHYAADSGKLFGGETERQGCGLEPCVCVCLCVCVCVCVCAGGKVTQVYNTKISYTRV